jgi:anti-anti-sigma regulatory factor
MTAEVLIVRINGIEIRTPRFSEEVKAGAFRGRIRVQDTVTIAELANRITTSQEADEVDELAGFNHLIERLRQRGNGRIALNMSKVTEIDLAAERRLIDAKISLERELGGEVVLVGLSVHRLTIMTKLLTVFTHFSSDEEALIYLAARPCFPAS